MVFSCISGIRSSRACRPANTLGLSCSHKSADILPSAASHVWALVWLMVHKSGLCLGLQNNGQEVPLLRDGNSEELRERLDFRGAQSNPMSSFEWVAVVLVHMQLHLIRV